MPARRIVITGGSGFLGQNLARHLAERSWDVVIVARHAPTDDGPWSFAKWDARTVGDWCDALDGARAVINLAGRSVDCIKTPDHCDEILRSRVESTRAVGTALNWVANRPAVWVQMSTAHIYGDPPELVCDESSATGDGLAPTVGHAWEKACYDTAPDDVRKVILRTSFVLGRSGGALRRLALLARVGLGGTMGRGRQGMSWIHVQDMNRLFERAIMDDTMSGTYVATAPNPVSNREFMRQLRSAVHMPIGLPAPAFAVRIAAPLLLRTDPELALYGRYCVSQRLAEEDFEFAYPTIDVALRHLLETR